MGKTTNLGLHTTASDETSKTFLEYRTELSGTGADSNMNIIDKAYGEMDAKIDANKQTETEKFSTLDSTVSGIQSGLSQEISTRASGDQLLQSQIDQIVAPSGTIDGASAAEVENARVGVDSTTYASLGEAIRGQVSNLKNDIVQISTCINEADFNWSKGVGVNGNSGAQESNPKVALSKMFAVGKGIYIKNLTPSRINIDSTDYYAYININKYSFTDGYQSRITEIYNSETVYIDDCDQISIQAVIQTIKLTQDIIDNYYRIVVSRTMNSEQDMDVLRQQSSVLLKEASIDTTWVSGRYLENDVIGSPRTHTPTLSSYSGFRFDEKFWMFYLKPGFQVAFPQFKDGVDKVGSSSFISTPGIITLDDIIQNASHQGEGTDSFAIMIRRIDNKTILSTYDADNALVELIPGTNLQSISNKSKWYAIGDSITDGRCSYFDENEVAHSNTNHYKYYGYVASQILNMNPVIEYGYGGMGWVHVANDGTYLTDVLAMDFDNPDLITVCLGVNDTGLQLGTTASAANDGTISGAIRNCCEVLGTKYKDTQIVFLTPLNSTKGGSASTSWMKNSGTSSLNQIADMIKYWCEKYGFCCIDMLHNCPINDFNIQKLIPDTLHPSVKGHELIGKYLAAVLPHRN